MEPEREAKLQFLIGEELLDIPDAVAKHPQLVSQAVESAQSTITWVSVENIFLQSLQSPRERKPYRLAEVAASGVHGKLDHNSLEARFFSRRGVKGVVALAAALADNKQTATLLTSLPPKEITVVIDSIDKIKPHDDFTLMCLEVGKSRRYGARYSIYLPGSQRKPKKRDTHQKSVAGPGASSNTDVHGTVMPLREGPAKKRRRVSEEHTSQAYRPSTAEGRHDPPLFAEHRQSGGVCLDTDPAWEGDANYGIDLDTLDLDYGSPKIPENFGVDLDSPTFS
ncbi:hypothetical protein TOPH_09126 [Tolypocladium ophioglossoides CBS 100239]|uniref:Uncharacterized protein n=1 Tax=Tolypocladium ophioglossoides (strain CBS 100239) TaxID=1163406 RepID=A0A0L0MWU4_TOLOC|nr:hypothetical protein TOPH_09126 [Tolypocladium ophioglossoides CBS 100239]